MLKSTTQGYFFNTERAKTFWSWRSIEGLDSREKQGSTLARNKPWLLRIGLMLDEDELRALIQLLLEEFLEDGTNAVNARHTTLLVPASAYTSGTVVPTLSNKMNHEAVMVEETKLRVVQRAAASETFYGCSTSRFDTNSSTGRFATVFLTKHHKDESHSLNHKRFTCWFGVVIHFIMIVVQGIPCPSCSVHHTVRCV